MKHLNIIFLSVLIAFPITIFSQTINWVNLNTGTTKNINDILFLSADTGYIVGDDYLFKKTTDGGMSWFDLPAPTIGERQGNNGKIIGVEYHNSLSFSNVSSGLILTFAQPKYNVVTDDEGATYSYLHHFDSSSFCFSSGFEALHQSSGYTPLITFGEGCNGKSIFSVLYEGPFTYHSIDSSYSVNGSFTALDFDTSQYILGHADGSLLSYSYNSTSLFKDTVFLDSSGVSAIAFAGNNTWYASVEKSFFPIYISTDNGSSYQIDSTFYPTFFYPIINDMDFLNDKIGMVGATANTSHGVVIVKDLNGWNYYNASHPVNSVTILKDETAYAAGDSGLVMKASKITSIIVEEDILQQVKIYPNPANEILNIEINGNLKVQQLRLFNINGQLMGSLSIEDTKIKVAHLPTGLYFLEVVTDKGRLAKKLAIN